MQRTTRETTVYPIAIRELQVQRIEDLSPHMRRVVLGGPGLEAHERNGVPVPAFRSTGFDDDVKIIVPDPVTGLCAIPEPQPGGTVAWTDESVALARTYTVRSVDTEAGEVALDFVLHGTGLASGWARRVRPGESVYVAGPKASAAAPEDVDWLLLAGDDTALPAIARALEDLPRGTRVHAVVEVPTDADRIELRTEADVTLTWAVREAGEDLVSAVQGVDWLPGEAFAWVAGEALSIKPLRRWLREKRGVTREHTDISGYWRRRNVVSVADSPDVVDVGATGPSAEARLHELTELAPALLVRTACALGVFSHVDDGATSVPALARVLDLPETSTGRLVRALRVHDLLTGDDDAALGLSETGVLLADPDSRLVRSLSPAATVRELSLAGLDRALATGAAVPVDTDGRHWDELCSQDEALAAQADDQVAEEAWFTAPAVPAAVGLEESETVVFAGPGCGVYAEEAMRRVPGLRAVLAGSDAEVRRGLADVSGVRREHVQTLVTEEPADVPDGTATLLLLDPFGSTPAAGHAALLDRAVQRVGRVVVITALVDTETPDEFDVEEDLRRLCLSGGEIPTRRRLSSVAADAGVLVHAVNPVGWGVWAVELRPLTGRV
ncbi:siderophore-interacting protein [Kocuria sp. HSID17590]|uniref:siderophore-interacting protein n=2 Tax=unclassified Kocuria TaxID=2649579 RepID=UPI000F85D508|nr:siderophore-interacting protein [Kocuria sp. HSID17590]RUP80711.1 siderophore-interacting protein [Kocuria sp. HSID17590]